MSVIQKIEPTYSLFERCAIAVLRRGAVPEHVAFIMDGNRRFAKAKGMEDLVGHKHGFDKLLQMLPVYQDLGIKEITIYAFSIENFKRTSSEVDALFDLFCGIYQSNISNKAKLCRDFGMKVKVIGDRSRLSKTIQSMIEDVEETTRGGTAYKLNVAVSYTSRDEITHAIREVCAAVEAGLLQPEDITEQVLEGHLYLPSSPDLLIRTSGEVRLSDFLLWQSTFSVIHFTKVLWPDLTVKGLLAGIFLYQRQKRQIELKKMDVSNSLPSLQSGATLCGDRLTSARYILLGSLLSIGIWMSLYLYGAF